MPTADELAPAVAAGIITADQAARIAALDGPPAVAAAQGGAAVDAEASDADEEIVHFARGFQDVFLTIGLVLLMVGIGIAGPIAFGAAGGLYAGAVVAFALAWYFARSRRLVLPSIVLALGFTLFVGVATGVVLGGEGWGNLFPGMQSASSAPALLGGGLAAVAAAAAFYAIFRLPFALGLVAAALVYVANGGLILALGMATFSGVALYVLLVMGLVTFAVAMAFDLSDPRRRTLRSDNAFWLHLVAAPMIVHSLVALLVEHGRTNFNTQDSLVVIAIVVALGVVALIIDRRALLVAGLGYLGFAVAQLLVAADLAQSGVLAATLLFVGAAVVILGAGWRPIRGALLRLVGEPLRRRLPPAVRV